MAIAPPPLPKAAPTQDQIDPRLIDAQPGHYMSPELSGTLTVAEDQYYRRQNQMLDDYRRNNAAAPSWQHQLQQAATPNPQSSHQVPGRGWSYVQPARYISPTKQSQAPLYVQASGQRQGPLVPQAHHGVVGGSCNDLMSPPARRLPPFQSLYQSFPGVGDAYSAAGPTSVEVPQRKNGFAYEQFTPRQQPLQHFPILPKPSQSPNQQPLYHSGPTTPTQNFVPLAQSTVPQSAAIPTADIAHLRGNEWAEVAQQRVREFNELSQQEKAQKLLQLHQAQAEGPSAPAPQPQHAHYQSSQQTPAQHANGQTGQGFTNHPGYSNIRSVFPDIQFNGMMSANQSQRQDNVGTTGHPFGTDPRWK